MWWFAFLLSILPLIELVTAVILCIAHISPKMDHHEESKQNYPHSRQMAKGFELIINAIQDNPTREGLLKTPERAANAMQFFTKGYHEDGAAILRSAMFKEDYSEMVIVKDIELYSLCEHH